MTATTTTTTQAPREGYLTILPGEETYHWTIINVLNIIKALNRWMEVSLMTNGVPFSWVLLCTLGLSEHEIELAFKTDIIDIEDDHIYFLDSDIRTIYTKLWGNRE